MMQQPAPVTSVPGIESIEKPDNSSSVGAPSITISPIMIIVILFIAYFTFDFWGTAIHSFIKQYLNGGRDAPWTTWVLYAIMITMALVIAMYYWGIPLSTIQGTPIENAFD